MTLLIRVRIRLDDQSGKFIPRVQGKGATRFHDSAFADSVSGFGPINCPKTTCCAQERITPGVGVITKNAVRTAAAVRGTARGISIKAWQLLPCHVHRNQRGSGILELVDRSVLQPLGIEGITALGLGREVYARRHLIHVFRPKRAARGIRVAGHCRERLGLE